MITAVNTSPFHLIYKRKKNTWYSIKDGNWEDPNVWMSNALDRRLITVPQTGDDVYINHSVNLDTNSLQPTSINNLFISGKLTASNNSQALTINGNLQAVGLIDFTGSNVTLNINGLSNSIIPANFIAGNSTINFGAIYNDQFILNLSYKNLSTSGAQKYMISDLTIAGTFTSLSAYECGPYNLTVTGSATLGSIGSAYKFTKSSTTGSLLFIGNVNYFGTIDLSGGNPNVELRGGMLIQTFGANMGTGTYTFSTNSQTINYVANFGSVCAAPIVVSGAITVTLTGGPFRTNSTISGTV